MTLKTTPFDAADHLTSVEAIEAFLNEDPDDTPEMRAYLTETVERAKARWGIVWPVEPVEPEV